MSQYGNDWGAILLAAGFSRRFGRPKLLQPLADGTPLGIPSARALQAVFSQVVAVINPHPQYAQLAAHYQAIGIDVLINEQAEQGMGSSIAKGVQYYPHCRGWVIALADMPLLQVSTIQSVAAVLATKAGIVAPVYHGRRGHPVGFSSSFAAELLALQGDKGASALFQRYPAAVNLIPINDEGVLRDIDTPVALAQLWREK